MPLTTSPTLTVADSNWVDLNQPIFFHSTDGTPGNARTDVRLKVSQGILSVQFQCLDNPYWKHNSFTEHNTDLWRQEVFEIFIAEGKTTPQRYLELEINPNNAFFAAWVDNVSGQGPEKLTMLAHDEHGIRHEVSTRVDDWSGTIEIPLSLLGEGLSKNYRINFYRIVLHSEPTDNQWECSLDNCDFLCWSPTMSETQPAFHRPAHFGTLTLEN
jgi:hypothetical protein